MNSDNNPADHALRGLKAKKLNSSKWFPGQDFLWHDKLPRGGVKVGDTAVEGPNIRYVFAHKISMMEFLCVNASLGSPAGQDYSKSAVPKLADNHDDNHCLEF